jgi:hypothetical protein
VINETVAVIAKVIQSSGFERARTASTTDDAVATEASAAKSLLVAAKRELRTASREIFLGELDL